MIRGGTSQNLSSFYFHNSRIYVEIMTQNVNFPIGPVLLLNTWCHSSHGLLTKYNTTEVIVISRRHLLLFVCLFGYFCLFISCQSNSAITANNEIGTSYVCVEISMGNTPHHQLATYDSIHMQGFVSKEGSEPRSAEVKDRERTQLQSQQSSLYRYIVTTIKQKLLNPKILILGEQTRKGRHIVTLKQRITPLLWKYSIVFPPS